MIPLPITVVLLTFAVCLALLEQQTAVCVVVGTAAINELMRMFVSAAGPSDQSRVVRDTGVPRETPNSFPPLRAVEDDA